MQIRRIDRANGAILETIPIDKAAEIIAQVNMCEAGDVRRGLLQGQAFRTAGFHYEITPEALAAYRAGKLECEYDRIAMEN